MDVFGKGVKDRLRDYSAREIRKKKKNPFINRDSTSYPCVTMTKKHTQQSNFAKDTTCCHTSFVVYALAHLTCQVTSFPKGHQGLCKINVSHMEYFSGTLRTQTVTVYTRGGPGFNFHSFCESPLHLIHFYFFPWLLFQRDTGVCVLCVKSVNTDLFLSYAV